MPLSYFEAGAASLRICTHGCPASGPLDAGLVAGCPVTLQMRANVHCSHKQCGVPTSSFPGMGAP